MGAIFLAGHICSTGGKSCASPQLNPFETGGPEVRLGVGGSPGVGGSWLRAGMNPDWRGASVWPQLSPLPISPHCEAALLAWCWYSLKPGAGASRHKRQEEHLGRSEVQSRFASALRAQPGWVPYDHTGDTKLFPKLLISFVLLSGGHQ